MLELLIAWFILAAAGAAHENEGRDPVTNRSRFTHIGRTRHRTNMTRLSVQVLRLQGDQETARQIEVSQLGSDVINRNSNDRYERGWKNYGRGY